MSHFCNKTLIIATSLSFGLIVTGCKNTTPQQATDPIAATQMKRFAEQESNAANANALKNTKFTVNIIHPASSVTPSTPAPTKSEIVPAS